MIPSPITLVPVGGPTYAVIKGHLWNLYRGAWLLDVELSPESLQQYGMPAGPCVVTFGGVPMTGTIDPNSSGSFGPSAHARIVGGANGWSTQLAAPLDFHVDNGVSSTTVYQAVASQVGETVVDLVPTVLGVDVVVNTVETAAAVFRDATWFIDATGTTYVGPRPPSIADSSLIIQNFDPVNRRVSFSCDTLLLPNTPLVDTRFGTQAFVAYNVEQTFDASGSRGVAYVGPVALPGTQPATIVVDPLKAATLDWTRAPFLRTYRYRLIQYQGDGPGGGPNRQALQAVTPSAGMPNLIPVAPWSGVAGVVSTLAPSQEVLVVFENANPSLPRVIGYSLVASDGQPLGLPLKTSMDAQVELDVGPTVPLVNIAGGAGALVLAPWASGLATALSAFTTALGSASDSAVTGAASALATALGMLPPPATIKTRAT